MNILDMANSFEMHICNKADLNNIPIGATFELIPTCNMNCKMCYVRISQKEMIKQGGYLPKERWFQFLESAQKAGTLFLLLTGGEPLLHPDFREIYLKAKSLGFVVCVNTNGTLIDKEMAEFFAQNASRRLNISIYGSSNETYYHLCNNPTGFDQFNNSIQLLKQRKVPIKLNCSLTPQNYHELDEMILYAKHNDLKIDVISYMFPPHRKSENNLNLENRLSIEQQVKARIQYEQSISNKNDFIQKAKSIVYCLENDIELPAKKPNIGFTCRSGSSTYWINWQGMMIPCGMFDKPKIDLKDITIEQAFQSLVLEVKKLKRANKCYQCKKEYICQICPAATVAETGRFDGVSEHHCSACDLYINEMKKYLKDNHISLEEDV